MRWFCKTWWQLVFFTKGEWIGKHGGGVRLPPLKCTCQTVLWLNAWSLGVALSVVGVLQSQTAYKFPEVSRKRCTKFSSTFSRWAFLFFYFFFISQKACINIRHETDLCKFCLPFHLKLTSIMFWIHPSPYTSLNAPCPHQSPIPLAELCLHLLYAWPKCCFTHLWK